MSLDQFGKIAAAEIAFYSPLLLFAFFTALRHGFGRQEGWVYLFAYSLGVFYLRDLINITDKLSIVRIVGAAVTIASKTPSSSQTGLAVAAAVLSAIGLSPLLLATQAFVTKMWVKFFFQRAPALRVI
jgi:hypothetical protein